MVVWPICTIGSRDTAVKAYHMAKRSLSPPPAVLFKALSLLVNILYTTICAVALTTP